MNDCSHHCIAQLPETAKQPFLANDIPICHTQFSPITICGGDEIGWCKRFSQTYHETSLDFRLHLGIISTQQVFYVLGE